MFWRKKKSKKKPKTQEDGAVDPKSETTKMEASRKPDEDTKILEDTSVRKLAELKKYKEEVFKKGEDIRTKAKACQKRLDADDIKLEEVDGT